MLHGTVVRLHDQGSVADAEVSPGFIDSLRTVNIVRQFCNSK